MAIQLAVSTRNVRLDAIETDLGADPDLEIFTGAQPANCAAADSGTKLVSMQLPADAFAAAASGAKGKTGTWSGTGITGGTAAHFRIKTAGGVVKVQGSVGQGSGDLSLDNTVIATSQAVTVTAFDLNDANG